MKINKPYLRDALTFLWIAILCFVFVNDAVWPFIIFFVKMGLYAVGGLLAVAGFSTLVGSFLKTKKDDDVNMDKSNEE